MIKRGKGGERRLRRERETGKRIEIKRGPERRIGQAEKATRKIMMTRFRWIMKMKRAGILENKGRFLFVMKMNKVLKVHQLELIHLPRSLSNAF